MASPPTARQTVQTLEQTCEAVPSQWEGHLADGRMFFVRLRNGRLQVRFSPRPTDNVMEAVRAEAVFEWVSDDPDDGFIEEAEMMDRTEVVLDFSLVRQSGSNGPTHQGGGSSG